MEKNKMCGLIDMHCDTVSRLQKSDGMNLWENDLQISVPGLLKAGTMAQFFACFINAAEYGAGQESDGSEETSWNRAYQAALDMIERARIETEALPEIAIAGSYEEIQSLHSRNQIAALLTIEEGGVLNSDISRLENLYQKGVRLITLTWNYENCLGFPNSREETAMSRGLKPFGIEAVEHMNDLGMIVDVSHLSEGGFWDCIHHSKTPIAASHSNARALCNHQRNLSDEMLRALGGKGGIAGINFYPVFLAADGKSNLETIAAHAKYMMNKAGEDAVAIGTDMDGYQRVEGAVDLRHVSEMPRLLQCFEKAGITPRQIDKIWSENVLRVIKEVL
ncbi:MAG: dipeptidase [Hespellia sp.]|nr:dipeptidase [Hespellia sp.]